jgi:hypothetical protein
MKASEYHYRAKLEYFRLLLPTWNRTPPKVTNNTTIIIIIIQTTLSTWPLDSSATFSSKKASGCNTLARCCWCGCLPPAALLPGNMTVLLLHLVTVAACCSLAQAAAQCFPAPRGVVVGKNIWKRAQVPSPHAASAAACCDYCTSLSKVGVAGQTTCKAFTYEPAQAGGAACYLKDNIQTTRGGLKGMVSGTIHKLPPPAPPWVPPGPVVPIPRACMPPHDKYPFCDPKLPLDRRVDDLIQRLRLEEKPYLLIARESPKGNISRLGIPEYRLRAS